MKKEMLKGLLVQLHEGLQKSDDLDQETRRLLQTINRDIETVLQKKDAPDDPIYAALNERSKELYARFASKHPKIEPALRELVAILDGMGV